MVEQTNERRGQTAGTSQSVLPDPAAMMTMMLVTMMTMMTTMTTITMMMVMMTVMTRQLDIPVSFVSQ